VFVAAVVILNGISGGGYGSDEQLLVLVGWLTWILASDCMSELPHIITEEAQTGTLEQVSLLPLSLTGILILRSVAYFLGIGARGIIALIILLLFVTPRSDGNGLTVVVLFMVSLLGAYGLGFLFAGVAIVYKRAKSLTNLVFSLMIFLTGALVGLESLGSVFELLKYTFPLTWGISLMRSVMIGEQTPILILQNGELIGLMLHSVIYLAIGLLVFAWGYGIARNSGTLAHY
jgi:ABC-2 type transport system permease protein